MNSLFSELTPITSKIAFLKSNIDDIANELIDWQTSLVSQHNNSFKKEVVASNNLKTTLYHLCPLATGERRRYLFIPTKNEWVAFFDNGHVGTDRTSPKIIGKKLSAQTIYISYNLSSEETSFEYYNVLAP